MATIYLRSTGGNDANSGADKDNAKATLQAAMTAAGAGGRVLAASDHSESIAASTTLTSPGTAAAPTEVVSINWATDVPTAGASLVTTGNSNITFVNSLYVYGGTFSAGTSGNSNHLNILTNSDGVLVFDTCSLAIAGTTSANMFFGRASSGSVGALVVLRNTTLGRVDARVVMVVRCPVIWDGGGIVGTIPTVMAQLLQQGRIRIRGVDLNLASTLFDGTPLDSGEAQLNRCRLRSGVTIITGAIPGLHGLTVSLAECDHGTNYIRQYRQDYNGIATEDTVRKRTASLYSHKLVTSANSKFYSPLRSFPLAKFNAVEGSAVTVNVYTLTDGVTLNNEDFWIEASYLGNASYPLGSLASSAKANILATAANYATTAEEWTTTDITTPVKQIIPVTFTPQVSGWVYLTACLARPSTTVYVDSEQDIT